MKKIQGIFLILILLFSFCTVTGCEYTTDPGFDYLTPKVTPEETEPTAVPETPVPTETPVAEDPEATPTPLPDMNYTEGSANPLAEWNGERLINPAPVTIGELVYMNNFELSSGSIFPASGGYLDAEAEETDELYYNGEYSLAVTSRKENYHGLSGVGFALSGENGLDYAALSGHTLELHGYLYYRDELFGADPEITFALYDCYRTETAMAYTYNKNNEIEVDEDGNPILTEQEVHPIVSETTVPIDTWTEFTFTFTVTPETELPEDGMFVIATRDENENSLGMFASFYLDDVTIRVIE